MSDVQVRFGEVLTEWQAMHRHAVGVAADKFAALKAEADAIAADGRWTSGPSDMLSVLGRHSDELFHSRLLAWLLSPTAQHGLGRRFLCEFLDTVWPGADLMSTGPVRVELEETRSGVSDVSGETLEARADVVVYGDAVTIVIENKVGAGEQGRQCERLYWSFAGDPTEVRWLFLTPSGARPESAATTIDSWTSTSYGVVRAALAAAIDGAPARPDSVGRIAAAQYLATLDAHRIFWRRQS